MIGGLQAVADATAAVFAGGRRTGSAVLVDGQHLLTAAHVLRRTSEGAVAMPVDEVELVFPALRAGSGEAEARTNARRIPIDIGAVSADVAALDLGSPTPPWMPHPVALWAAQRLPDRVNVFGFPSAEGALHGVWREFNVSGPVAGGTVQLDWTGTSGTWRGHSGGPVVDAVTAALVGVLVEGSEEGHFDRFLPLSLVRRVWPDLPRPWLMAGLDARNHFTRRASGQRSRARGGDLFRGREAALTAARDWLTRPQAPGRVLVVTGEPGAGKSAVIARITLKLEDDGVGPGLAFHARAATHTEFLSAIADLIGFNGISSRDSLLDALAKTSGDQRWIVVLDALDEAASTLDRLEIAETLSELASLPQLRVAVATRPLAAGSRYSPTSLLARLGVTSGGGTNLVDLETDRYFDVAGLEAVTTALLAQEGVDHPGPPSCAWTAYRSNTNLLDRLARIVAARARRNYLVAAMAADSLSRSEVTVDPDAVEFDVASIPTAIGESLSKYLETLEDSERVETLGLLTALAYARGEGVDDSLWLKFAAALGYQSGRRAELDRLRESAVADFVLQTVSTDRGPVTTVFHQALADELLTRRIRPSDERAIFQTLLQEAASTGWEAASRYARLYAPDHAAASGDLLRLLDDGQFVVVADFTRLLPLLYPPELYGAIGATLRRAAAQATGLSPARRGRLLALTAAHLGLEDIRVRFANGSQQGLKPIWAQTLGLVHQELVGHSSDIFSVAVGRMGQRDIIVSGSWDRTIRIWSLATGEQLGQPLEGHSDAVCALALGRIADRDIVVSGSSDKTVRVWDMASGQQLEEALVGHTGIVSSVALGRIGERDVVVSGSSDGTLCIWDLATGQQLGQLVVGDGVTSVAVSRIGERDFAVSGSWDNTVRVWDLTTCQPLGPPFVGHSGIVSSVAVGRIGERDIVASGGREDDQTVRVWDLATGQEVGKPLAGHSQAVSSVAVGRIGQHDIVVSGSWDNTVRIWDLATGQQLGQPLVGHSEPVASVALGRVGERDVVVSGSRDDTVCIWDLVISQELGKPLGQPLVGHSEVVSSVAVGRMGQNDVVVSGSQTDEKVGVWELATGRQMAVLLAGDSTVSAVTSVAVGRIRQRDVVVAGSLDSSVCIWDLAPGLQFPEFLVGHSWWVTTVVVGRIGNRDVVVSGGRDRTVRIWDLSKRRQIGEPLVGHSDAISSVAIGRIGQRDVLASGGWDNTVRIWDLSKRRQIGEPLVGHSGHINSVAIGRIDQRDIVVSGSSDNTMRVWDLATGQQLGQPLVGHTDAVEAVAVGRMGQRDVVISGSRDRTVRVWDIGGATTCVLDLLAPVNAIGVVYGHDHGLALVVASGRALCVFEQDGSQCQKGMRPTSLESMGTGRWNAGP